MHERRIRDLENEVIMIKGVSRNEQANLNERLDTLGNRVKICQQEVNALARFDEKIKKMQANVVQITEDYNVTLTARLKEVSQQFIKQVGELDGKHREQHREIQEVLVKMDGLRDFTGRNEVRFRELQVFVSDLRETFEDLRLQFARDGQLGGEQSAEGKLKLQIKTLERQINEVQRQSQEQDNELKKGLHAVTNNRIEQLIFQG